MALEGSIRDFSLPDIIQFLRQQNKSGVLTIRTSGGWEKVLFEEGRIAFALTQNFQGAEGIAHKIIRAERISEAKIEELLKMNPGMAEFEASLVSSGVMTPDELTEFLNLQTREILFRLFRLEEGRYSFETNGTLERPTHITPMDADYILLEGMRQFDEWPPMRLKVLNNQIIFDKVADLKDKVEVAIKSAESSDEAQETRPEIGTIKVSEKEWVIFQNVNGLRDADKLVDICNVGEFETIRGLAALLAHGVIYQSAERQSEEAPSLGGWEPEPEIVERRSFFLTPGLWLNVGIVFILVIWILFFAPNVVRSIRSVSDIQHELEDQFTNLKTLGMKQAAEINFLREQSLKEVGEEASKMLDGAMDADGGPVQVDRGLGLE